MLIFFGQLWNAMFREKADHSIEANQGWGMCGDTCEDQEVFVIIIIIIIVLIIIIYPMVLWSSLIGLLYKSRSFYFVRLEFSLLEHLLAAKRVTLVDR